MLIRGEALSWFFRPWYYGPGLKALVRVMAPGLNGRVFRPG
jgi:hypothetical protein